MAPKITLYTAHHCPWAQRCQIAVRELGLDVETVLVDITVPRTAEYLTINPSGQVPTIVYGDHVLVESGRIVQFLADAHPSHLLKSSITPEGPLQRFQIGAFVDTFVEKVLPLFDRAVYAAAEDKTMAASTYVDAVVKYLEPLLIEAGPFFGRSQSLTLAEV